MAVLLEGAVQQRITDLNLTPSKYAVATSCLLQLPGRPVRTVHAGRTAVPGQWGHCCETSGIEASSVATAFVATGSARLLSDSRHKVACAMAAGRSWAAVGDETVEAIHAIQRTARTVGDNIRPP